MSDGESRSERGRRYRGVLRTVEHAGSDKPGMSEHALRSNRTSSGHDLRDVESTIQAARENGALVAIPDRDGHTRYVRTTDDAIREAIQWLVDDDDPDRKAIGRLNALLARD